MTIINMANAMYSNHHQQQHESDDRLAAARALLGVSPNSVADSTGALSLFGMVAASKEPESELPCDSASSAVDEPEAGESVTVNKRLRSDSVGLEALAFIATKEQATMGTASTGATADAITSNSFSVSEESSSKMFHDKPLIASAVSSSSSSSSVSDDDYMPPPPPRRGSARRRSVSNPEGMDRWAPIPDQNRLRFVLPASILEEELAEASAAMKAMQDQGDKDTDEQHNTSADEGEANDAHEEEELDQFEMLRRARSRLLEDLSEVNLNGEKGVLALPHALDKYKEVYNKNGRIGIYTAEERSAIIARFHDKRSRRVWNKKIRYNCRKNLADRRMRVKGRFVKRATEQEAKLAKIANNKPSVPSIPEDSNLDPASTDTVCKDEDMPDVNDPDAGFCPTDDQPFRRLRRHTIT